jgi:uncharacterized protein (DUF362 family)
MCRVAIVKTGKDCYASFSRAIDAIGGPVIARGDHVLIKPNLVEPADPDSGQITSLRVIEAAARYCLEQGAARVIIGEGPGYYQPESCLKQCFTRTGVSRLAERMGVEWVLFDEHSYRKFSGLANCLPDEFRITEFAFTCDKFINLPVLKTHYLTTVTLAMKNLKGCLKREDKPLFHYQDLSRAIVELCRLIRPSVNVIDCTSKTVVRQLGSGYASEQGQTGEGLLIASQDIVATDAVGSALMGIDPLKVRMVDLGAAAGLGESNLARMNIVGEELKRLKFKVKLPQEQLSQSFPLLQVLGADGACSGCLLPLMSELMRLHERGARLPRPLAICLGRDPEVPENKARILLGDCVKIENSGDRVGGCPPAKEALSASLGHYMTM